MRNREDGFTLIELVITLVVLSLIAVIAIPSFVSYQTSAQDDQVTIDAHLTVGLTTQCLDDEDRSISDPDFMDKCETTTQSDEVRVKPLNYMGFTVCEIDPEGKFAVTYNSQTEVYASAHYTVLPADC